MSNLAEEQTPCPSDNQTESLLTIQRDLAIALSTTSDFTEALKQLLATMIRIDAIDCGAVYRVDQKEGTLHMVVHTGLSPDFIEHTKFYAASSPHSRIVRAGKAIYGAYLDVVPPPDDFRMREGLRALAGVPVMFEGSVLVWLNLASRTAQKIPDTTRVIVESVAAMVGGMIVRIEAEKALKESQRNLQNLFDNLVDCVFVLDTDGMILSCNPMVENLLGYDAMEFIGHHIGLLHPPDQFDDVELIINGMRDRIAGVCLIPLIKKQGEQIPVETRITHGRWNGNAALFGICRDITQQKEQEEHLLRIQDELEQRVQERTSLLQEANTHLQHSQNLLQAIFDGLQDGLLLLDGNGTVQIANKATQLLFGEHFSGLRGQSWYNLCQHIAPDVASELHIAILEGTLEDTPYRLRYNDANKIIRVFDIRSMILRDSNNTIQQIIVHMVDVTEHIQLQTRMIENERFVASGMLAASVAHEINTPLQSLDFSLEMAQIAQEEKRDTFIGEAREEIQRIASIVRQLLDLYQPQALSKSPVDIHSLLERTLWLAGKWIRDHHIVVYQDIPSSLPTVWGYTNTLIQVFLNLIMNAVQAMPQGGTLHIQIRHIVPQAQDDTPSLCITIEDTGCGIPTDIQEYIFEPFVTTREHGTGLGLAISKQIIDQHEGSIWAENKPNSGCIFTILLPCSTSQKRSQYK